MALVHTDDDSQFWAYMGPPPRLKKTRARIVAGQRAPRIEPKVPFKKYPKTSLFQGGSQPAAKNVSAKELEHSKERLRKLSREAGYNEVIVKHDVEAISYIDAMSGDVPVDILNKRPIKMYEVMQEVCEKYTITAIDLKSKRRTRNLIIPRQEFFYRAWTETVASLPEIGRFCGGKDHTTVLHGARNHAQKNDLPVPGGVVLAMKHSKWVAVVESQKKAQAQERVAP